MGPLAFQILEILTQCTLAPFPENPVFTEQQGVRCIRIFIATTSRLTPNTKILNNSPPFFSYGNQKWVKILFWRYLKVFILRIFWANNKRFHEFFWLAEETQLNLHPRHCQKTKQKETRKIGGAGKIEHFLRDLC